MFFSAHNTEEKEEKKQQFDVPIDVNSLHLILYMVEYSVPNGKPFRLQELEQVYLAADVLKFPRIRKYCVQQLRERAVTGQANAESAKAAAVTVRLGLYDIFVDYSNLLPFKHVKVLAITAKEQRPCLSKADVPWFHDLLFPDTPFRHWRPERHVIRLEHILVRPKKAKDVTKRWPKCNVAIEALNSNGRILYGRQKRLSETCSRLCGLFDQMPQAYHNRLVTIPVPIEFVTMQWIMWILEDADNTLDELANIHTVLLYDMYVFSGPDQLDCQCIRDFATVLIISCPKYDTLDALDVARRMGLSDDEMSMIEERVYKKEQDYDSWINGRRLVYLRSGEEVDLTTSHTEKLLPLCAFFKTYPIKRN